MEFMSAREAADKWGISKDELRFFALRANRQCHNGLFRKLVELYRVYCLKKR